MTAQGATRFLLVVTYALSSSAFVGVVSMAFGTPRPLPGMAFSLVAGIAGGTFATRARERGGRS